MKTFIKKQPSNLRIWHWLNLIAISTLLLTGLLRKNWMNSKSNAQIIVQKSTELGNPLSPEFSRELAIAIRNPMWDWHYIAGFTLAALFLFRIYIYFKNKKNSEKMNFKDKSLLHKNLVQLSYLIFYGFVLFMILSGTVMYFKSELSIPKDIISTLKEIHELLIWFFGLFTVSHIIGVFVSELRGDHGLVSSMISDCDKKT